MKDMQKGLHQQDIEAFYDQTLLRSEAYPNSTNLNARADIYRFAVPDVPFPSWALSHLPEDLGVVVDVGCGPGLYLRALHAARRSNQLFGVDLSDGMLREVQSGIASLNVADAQRLPFRSNSFDTVVCMHVLYHVPDISIAVAELRRVTKGGGYLLAATNGSIHHRHLRETFDKVIFDPTGEKTAVLAGERRFRLEEGEDVLGAHFNSVQRFDLLRDLVIPEAGPVMRYLESIRSFHERRLPAGVTWDEIVVTFRKIVEREIDKEGAYRNPVHEGVFVCQRPKTDQEG